MNTQQPDPGREAILRGNEQRLNAYDAWRAERDQLIDEIGELRNQLAGALEQNRLLRNESDVRQTMIEDLQARERSLQLTVDLYMQSREGTLANLRIAQDAVGKAVSNTENAISHEVAGRKRDVTENDKRVSDLGERMLATLSRELGHPEPAATTVDAPSIAPEATQEEQPQRLVPRQPMQPVSAYPQQRFRAEQEDQ